MSAVIFCGPTLGAGDLAPYAHFELRPPVRQGELYAAARTKPKAIGIIDGYFDGVPAVWHKEVLWALSVGIPVFGASSMGALRAAELHFFGMFGVGRIFEDYRDGRLTDDDEVALLHGPAEAGYLKLSEPMVNIRATLERAVAERAIGTGAAKKMLKVAKAQFYQTRTWATVLSGAGEAVTASTLQRFIDWLQHGKVDQKRLDGLALLSAVHDFVARGERLPPVSFSFEWTETWANAPWLNRPHAGTSESEDAAILNELRLDGEAYSRIRHAALLQTLANDELARSGLSPARREVSTETTVFRSRRRLIRASAVDEWMVEIGIDEPHFRRAMSDRAGLEKLARLCDTNLQGAMLDQLRLEDAYPKLRKRARTKASSLAGVGAHLNVPPPVLLGWYFGTRLRSAMPDDLADYASSIGLPDLKDFYALIAAEYAVKASAAKRKPAGRPPK